MFTTINQLFAFITRFINILDILAIAGEKRAEQLSRINDHDIEKKDDALTTSMAEWKAKQLAKREAIISPAEFKAAASDS